MGLNCSHGAYDGGYIGFNWFRKEVARVIGGSYPPHYEMGEDGTPLKDPKTKLPYKANNLDDKLWYYDNDLIDEKKFPGIEIFLNHSDCEGELTPVECSFVADFLEHILPKMKQKRDVAQKFINGCRLAAKKNETLIFR